MPRESIPFNPQSSNYFLFCRTDVAKAVTEPQPIPETPKKAVKFAVALPDGLHAFVSALPDEQLSEVSGQFNLRIILTRFQVLQRELRLRGYRNVDDYRLLRKSDAIQSRLLLR